MLIKINEGSAAYLTIGFYDKSDANVPPTTVTYQVHDVASGTEMQAETSLTPAASIEIPIDPAVNAIVNSSLSVETRRVTIKASYGAGEEFNDEYDYLVRNLSYI